MCEIQILVKVILANMWNSSWESFLKVNSHRWLLLYTSYVSACPRLLDVLVTMNWMLPLAHSGSCSWSGLKLAILVVLLKWLKMEKNVILISWYQKKKTKTNKQKQNKKQNTNKTKQKKKHSLCGLNLQPSISN